MNAASEKHVEMTVAALHFAPVLEGHEWGLTDGLSLAGGDLPHLVGDAISFPTAKQLGGTLMAPI